MHTWWVITLKLPHFYKQTSCIMSIVLGGQPHGLQRNLGKSVCGLCGNREDASQVVFDCIELNDIRNCKIVRVYENMPNAMRLSIEGMSIREKAVFFLSPLKSKYVLEWDDIYKSIASFVFEIYKERAKKYDDIVK